MARNRSPVSCCQPVNPRTPAKECTANSLPVLMLLNTCNLSRVEHRVKGDEAVKRRLLRTGPGHWRRGRGRRQLVSPPPPAQLGGWWQQKWWVLGQLARQAKRVSAFTFSCSVKLLPAHLRE